MNSVHTPKGRLIKLAVATLVIAMTSCGRKNTVVQTQNPVPQEAPRAIPVPIRKAEPLDQILVGWLDDYSAHVEFKVVYDFPGLLAIPAARMTTVCPHWAEISENDRPKFWSALLYGISKPESNYERTMIYLEDTMPTDPITGYQVRSEGLLQLSYQDVLAHHYTGDDISWVKDKELAVADYKSHKKSGNPKRTILNAYANMNLGLHIMNRILMRQQGMKLSFEDALGTYWSSMRTKNKKAFGQIMERLQEKMPSCFDSGGK